MNNLLKEKIWDILVSDCGAKGEYLKEQFMIHYPECTEFRFQGALGFGGKIWFYNNKIYVSCYKEDDNENRNFIIEKVNNKLIELLKESTN